MDKIYYLPTEGATGFCGLRNVPRQPCLEKCEHTSYCLDSCEKYGDYFEALESCKSNKLEIVNPDDYFKIDFSDDKTITVITYSNGERSGIVKLLQPGDIFDLPIGYEFKQECKKCGSDEGSGTGNLCCSTAKMKVLRLVKTETKEENWNEADEKYLKSIDHHPIAVTYIRSLREEITRLKTQVPQPEPEESQKLYTLDEVKEILHNHHCDQFKLPRSTVFPEPNWTTEWVDKNLIQRKKQ